MIHHFFIVICMKFIDTAACNTYSITNMRKNLAFAPHFGEAFYEPAHGFPDDLANLCHHPFDPHEQQILHPG